MRRSVTKWLLIVLFSAGLGACGSAEEQAETPSAQTTTGREPASTDAGETAASEEHRDAEPGPQAESEAPQAEMPPLAESRSRGDPPREARAPAASRQPAEPRFERREETAMDRAPAAANGAAAVATPDHAVVEVFYATDRNRTGDSTPRRFYGGDRGELRYGMCRVSIPREHRMGALESPSIWRLEFRQNPDKHVVLLALEEQDRATYLSNLAARVRASDAKAALLFVHGYNVTFEDAARRTAQLHYDLGFDGAPVFYSWPSRGEFAAYPVDETNVQWTHVHLVEFLEHFVEGSEAEHIYVIAHSMGNRAVTRAVGDYLRTHSEAAPRFREIILTAPDIDADVFRREVAPGLAAFGAPITLYASSRDKALVASKSFHGYARAGDAGAGVVVMSGIETIDASAVDTSLLGHSYYGDARSVLADLYYLVREGKRAPQRFSLVAKTTPDGEYWEFRP